VSAADDLARVAATVGFRAMRTERAEEIFVLILFLKKNMEGKRIALGDSCDFRNHLLLHTLQTHG
jgi:hypothetical protein